VNHVVARMRVREAYVPGYLEPIRFKQGEAVNVGHHDQQWTAYCWCTAQSGEQGWVPDSYLDMTGPSEAVAKRDYDGTELTVGKDEIVEVLDDEGGWLLCRTSMGSVGWLPGDILETA
jgi:Variant SH3 domain